MRLLLEVVAAAVLPFVLLAFALAVTFDDAAVELDVERGCQTVSQA